MNILALDLGTDCGFVIFKDGKFISGTKKLGTYKEKFGERFYEFRKWLLNVIEKHNIEAVYFERVYGHKGVEAGHCYGGFMYTLASVCYQQNIPCISFSVQAIKKFITAKGNARKNEIIASVKQKSFNPETDDEADAIAIMLLVPKEAINNAKKTDKNENGSFQALKKSGSKDPRKFSSVRIFSFTLLYSKMKSYKAYDFSQISRTHNLFVTIGLTFPFGLPVTGVCKYLANFSIFSILSTALKPLFLRLFL